MLNFTDNLTDPPAATIYSLKKHTDLRQPRKIYTNRHAANTATTDCTTLAGEHPSSAKHQSASTLRARPTRARAAARSHSFNKCIPIGSHQNCHITATPPTHAKFLVDGAHTARNNGSRQTHHKQPLQTFRRSHNNSLCLPCSSQLSAKGNVALTVLVHILRADNG